MGLILNSNAPNKILYNGAEVSLYFNGSKIWPDSSPTPPGPDPYNPLNLPANTVRVRTNDRNPPNKGSYTTYETATLVSGTTDVYDVYKSGTNFDYLFFYSRNIVEVLGANTTGITSMNAMFIYCDYLTSVSLFDTSNVTSMTEMFYICSSLTVIPLFDTSNTISMLNMFRECVNVQSGALALYQQASTQQTPPNNHAMTFYNCGSNTTTGSAELAQIPTSWGGTMS